MPLINVLCAPPNGRNPGMASVDLALAGVAGELDGEVVRWRLWDQSEWVDPPGGSSPVEGGFQDEMTGLTYRSLRGREEEFLASDAVVFWGDFHHMSVYLDDTAHVLHERMRAMNRDDAERLARQTLLLDGQDDDVLARTVTFGTTLAFNTPGDYRGPYGERLEHFLARVHGAWFRDGYSARVAELARAPRSESALGADAAFLADGPSHTGSGGSLGVFFGRAAIAPEAVARLGRGLATATGLRPEWIPWGTYPAMWPMRDRKRLRLAWPQLEGVTASRSPAARARHLLDVARGPGLPEDRPSIQQLFEQLAAHRAIVTDTYHLAVNAWRTGTPALLVVDPPSGAWSVNSGDPSGARDKRHDLYSQLDALPYLLSADRLPRGRAVGALAERLLDEQLADGVRERARLMAQHARTRVVRSIGELL